MCAKKLHTQDPFIETLTLIDADVVKSLNIVVVLYSRAIIILSQDMNYPYIKQSTCPL